MALKRCVNVVIGWVPDRKPFDRHPARGRVVAFIPPETSFTWQLPYTVGANTAGWQEAGASGRQALMQGYVTEMADHDNIRPENIRRALREIDEWQSFPFTI
jgi:hypothetical protein